MIKRTWRAALVIGAVGVALNAWAAPGAEAALRPPGGFVQTGSGTLGTPWLLKVAWSAVNGHQTVREQFEIQTSANTPPDGIGQPWHVVLAENGVVVLDDVRATTPTNVIEGVAAHAFAGSLHLTVHADNQVTGETIDAAGDVP